MATDNARALTHGFVLVWQHLTNDQIQVSGQMSCIQPHGGQALRHGAMYSEETSSTVKAEEILTWHQGNCCTSSFQSGSAVQSNQIALIFSTCSKRLHTPQQSVLSPEIRPLRKKVNRTEGKPLPLVWEIEFLNVPCAFVWGESSSHIFAEHAQSFCIHLQTREVTLLYTDTC